ncbi:hypothetical protein [Ruegeria marisrubri]|uniref:hypothetical protein n=1 Tax=Ruegeria marisrubri TaxID=1685379 RepID=UPI0012FE4A51|nr:hypothetical protein [Ruegeria marisrubri]
MHRAKLDEKEKLGSSDPLSRNAMSAYFRRKSPAGGENLPLPSGKIGSGKAEGHDLDHPNSNCGIDQLVSRHEQVWSCRGTISLGARFSSKGELHRKATCNACLQVSLNCAIRSFCINVF